MPYPTARQISNILVGVGKIEINDTAGAGNLTAGSTAVNPGGVAIAAFDPTKFNDLGYTVDGVEITFEPDLVDIKVDQLGDAAKLVEQMTKVRIKTVLSEATLENLAVAWGYESGAVNESATNPSSSGITGSTFKRLSLGAFATAIPVERSLRFTGKSPFGLPRVYVCTRVVQMAASGHAYKRGEATLFPVEFRVLPDASLTGSEYGYILDAVS